MSDHILVLHPENPFAAFSDVILLESHLREIGFLGERYTRFGNIHFRLGNEFFKFINFDHSHTTILLENSPDGIKEVGQTDSRYLCNIQLSDITLEPSFLGTANTLSPLCPTCTYEPVDSPFDLIGHWLDDTVNFIWKCPICGNGFPIQKLNWRRSTGFGRQQIRIWEIWAGEATPTNELLTSLQDITATKWTYFYYHL